MGTEHHNTLSGPHSDPFDGENFGVRTKSDLG